MVVKILREVRSFMHFPSRLCAFLGRTPLAVIVGRSMRDFIQDSADPAIDNWGWIGTILARAKSVDGKVFVKLVLLREPWLRIIHRALDSGCAGAVALVSQRVRGLVQPPFEVLDAALDIREPRTFRDFRSG